MYKLFVAFRYLRRNWLNLVGVAAVAIGVLVLICVLSVMKGFDEEFRARLRATVADLVLEAWSDETFGGYEDLMRRIEAIPHVVACAPRYEGLALIRLDSPYGKKQRYAQFNGVDLDREVKATDFGDYWRAWRGRAAREQLEQIPLTGDPSFATLTKAQLVDLLPGLRPDDLAAMDGPHREALRSACARNGIDLQALMAQSITELPQWGVVENPEQESPAFAGAELLVLGQDASAQPVSLGLDDRVTVFTPTDLFDGRAIRRCRIKGAFRSGLYDYDLRNIYLPLTDVQTFMSKKGHVTSINIRLDSFDNAREVRARLLGILTPQEMRHAFSVLAATAPPDRAGSLRLIEPELARLERNADAWFAEGNPHVLQLSHTLQQALLITGSGVLTSMDRNSKAVHGLARLSRVLQEIREREGGKIGSEFNVSTWEDKRRAFLRAVELERRIMGFILFFVILIAGFLILSILHTTVLAKTRDIGVLKAIGGSPGGVMSIFLLNGFLMGIVGSALGTAAGVVITRNINGIEGFLHRIIGFSLFPANIYYLDKIPTEKDPLWSTIIICASAILVSLVASAYPAWKASRMDAVEALRYE